MSKKYRIGYTTGVYDLFHIGHLNILEKAKEQCETLIVGVSTDELVKSEKSKTPVIPFEERIRIIESIRYVDKAVPQFNKNKMEAYEKFRFDAMFVGSDWKGTPQWNGYEKEFSEIGVDIIYLPHTDGTSSTLLTEVLNEALEKKNEA